MFNSIRNLPWHLKSPATKRLEEEEAMEQGFHDLPSTRERTAMSPQKLAILLATCEKDSPQYILVSHELNLRIAQVSSRATYGAAAVGLAGVVLGAFLAVAAPKLEKLWQDPAKVQDQGNAKRDHVGDNQRVGAPQKQLAVAKQSAVKKMDVQAETQPTAASEPKQ